MAYHREAGEDDMTSLPRDKLLATTELLQACGDLEIAELEVLVQLGGRFTLLARAERQLRELDPGRGVTAMRIVEREEVRKAERQVDACRMIHRPGCATYACLMQPCDCGTLQVAPWVSEQVVKPSAPVTRLAFIARQGDSPVEELSEEEVEQRSKEPRP